MTKPENHKLTLLAEMLEMQDGINKTAHPEWRLQGFNWKRVIWIECAEMMDAIGWRWWKQQRFHRDHVAMKLVGIWHLIMSWALEDEGHARVLTRSCVRHCEYVPGVSQDLEFLRGHTESMADFALISNFKNTIESFFMATANHHVQLGFDELYRLYISKNVMTFFRQDHGFGRGSYRMLWSDQRTDTAHLAEVVAECANSDDFAADVYAALQVRYAA